jgi:hypothetical protein
MLWLVSLICSLNKNFYFFFVKRRASSSVAVASTANQNTTPQKKSNPFGLPQRVNLPKESVNVR